jgi:hypothetical protein
VNRTPITDNAVIEKHLGKQGIICTEDLIHEIFTVGPHFKVCALFGNCGFVRLMFLSQEANRFLWPFKLNSPLGGFSKKTVHYVEVRGPGNCVLDCSSTSSRVETAAIVRTRLTCSSARCSKLVMNACTFYPQPILDCTGPVAGSPASYLRLNRVYFGGLVLYPLAPYHQTCTTGRLDVEPLFPCHTHHQERGCARCCSCCC